MFRDTFRTTSAGNTCRSVIALYQLYTTVCKTTFRSIVNNGLIVPGRSTSSKVDFSKGGEARICSSKFGRLKSSRRASGKYNAYNRYKRFAAARTVNVRSRPKEKKMFAAIRNDWDGRYTDGKAERIAAGISTVPRQGGKSLSIGYLGIGCSEARE